MNYAVQVLNDAEDRIIEQINLIEKEIKESGDDSDELNAMKDELTKKHLDLANALCKLINV